MPYGVFLFLCAVVSVADLHDEVHEARLVRSARGVQVVMNNELENVDEQSERGRIDNLVDNRIEEASDVFLKRVDEALLQGDVENMTEFEYLFNNAAATMLVKEEEKDNRFFNTMLGTYWCGPGNRSWDNWSTGLFARTDSCCRTHDFCVESINAGDTKYGLTNSSPFTRLNCDCDKAFYDCLKEVNSMVSSKIGIIYFDILGPDCFKDDFPISGCKVTVSNRCMEYILDTTSTTKYQWFNAQFY